MNKIHSTSSGKAKKFVKLFSDGTLRWANKDSEIGNPKKIITSKIYIIISVTFVNVIALLYGKLTKSLRKSSNNKLETQ